LHRSTPAYLAEHDKRRQAKQAADDAAGLYKSNAVDP
jgi:hypothetical protein